jgi:uncharacterized membrane protein
VAQVSLLFGLNELRAKRRLPGGGFLLCRCRLVAFHIKPELYLKIMPPYLPWRLALVRVSGFFDFEILAGLALLVQRTRRAVAWGLVAF